MIDEAALQTAFNAVIAGREVSSFHADIARMIAQLMLASRGMTDAGQLVSSASEISRLEALLPPVVADAGELMDLRKLTDAELHELQRIQDKACGIDTPLWEPEPSTERQPGPCELEAIRLGQYLDEHNHEWRHRALLEPERAVLMNMFGGLGFCAGIIVRNLFRPIFMADAQAEIEKAVRAALIASGSDASMVPMTPEEKARLAPPALLDGPPEPPRTNGAGDLTAVWPFSPDKPPQ